MTLSTALFIFAAQLLAYLVKGLIGFGNPLISAPILSMGLDNVVITPGTLLLDCPVNAWITWKNRHSFQWRKILPLLAAASSGRGWLGLGRVRCTGRTTRWGPAWRCMRPAGVECRQCLCR